MSVRRRRVDESFAECIEEEIERIERGDNAETVEKHVFNGLYSVQINYFLKYFPRENMKFILFEEFTANPEAVCKDIFRFLGVAENPRELPTISRHSQTISPVPGRCCSVRKRRCINSGTEYCGGSSLKSWASCLKKECTRYAIGLKKSWGLPRRK